MHSSSSLTAGASSLKISKYTLVPATDSDTASTAASHWIWAKLLLAALNHSSSSTGTRKFLLQPDHDVSGKTAVIVWLFTVRTAFTASDFTFHPTLSSPLLDSPTVDATVTAEAESAVTPTSTAVWKGSKLLYRHVVEPYSATLATTTAANSTANGDPLEPVVLPDHVYTAVTRMLTTSNMALHPSTREVTFPTHAGRETWHTGYLVTPSYT